MCYVKSINGNGVPVNNVGFEDIAVAGNKEEAGIICSQKRTAAEEAAREKTRRNNAVKERLVQEFAIREAPSIWRTVQTLRAEIAHTEAGLKNLREEFLALGRNPEQDDDFIKIGKMRDQIKSSLSSIYKKLEDAYIAAKKYEATPGRKDYEHMCRKTLEDGIQEAEMTTTRFKEMRKNK